MNQAKYLDRIGYKGELSISVEALKKLQQKHLFAIPFENLDIHYGNKIELDTEKLYNKIVTHNRGGFCYELNGLFCELLRSIGFKAQLVSARVHEQEGSYSPEFDHLAIIVRVDETDYLVDVGFGEFIFGPLKMEAGIEQHDLRETYRIDSYNHTYQRVTKKESGEWVPEYIFDPQQRELVEFEPRCNFHQTDSNSHFQQKKVCSLPIEGGRKTISSDKVKIKRYGQTKERKLENEKEFLAALREHFQIEL